MNYKEFEAYMLLSTLHNVQIKGNLLIENKDHLSINNYEIKQIKKEAKECIDILNEIINL